MKFAAAALIATVSAECMEGIKMETFSDAECKTAISGASHNVTKEELKNMNQGCVAAPAKDKEYWKAKDFDAKTMKVQCDTSNLKTTVYAEE